MLRIILTTGLLVLAIPLAAAETGWRKWKSAAGTVIEGRVVSWVPCPRVEESGVELETSDGRKLRVTYQQLSLDDQVWLLQNHKDELTGAGASPDAGEQAPADGKPLIKKVRAPALEPGQLFEPPPEVDFDRRAIPVMGTFDDDSSRAVNLVTNHLFWLTKTGYTKFDLGRDETSGWKKIQRAVGRRFRAGDSWKIGEAADLALEMLEREGKDIPRIRCWTIGFMGEQEFKQALFGPTLVLISAEAHRKDRYQWTTVLPVLRWEKGGLVVSYDGEATSIKLEERKPANGDPGMMIKPGIRHQGFRLVIDPGDRSKLASMLAEDEVELRIKPGQDSFCVIDLDVNIPNKPAEEGE